MDGRPFRMLKFRTMNAGADAGRHKDYVVDLIHATGSEGSGPKRLYKLEADPRVTKGGRLLRQLSIDELPQLFNVLKGEMSLVGPRPSLPYEAAVYDDWHRRRFDVRPGMTGLWQVSGRSRLSYHDMVRLDVSYIDSWSPIKDLLIIMQTLPAVLRKEAS
jgi:lipopolysaccharide/colanic/teichoic acid biosynthesis glycosyltransferase